MLQENIMLLQIKKENTIIEEYFIKPLKTRFSWLDTKLKNALMHFYVSWLWKSSYKLIQVTLNGGIYLET